MSKTKKGTGDFCSSINCQNSRRKCPDLPFFRLPAKDEERCKKWIINMRRQDLLGVTMEGVVRAGYRLCAIHFESSQFNVPSERKRLVWNAIPTIFDVPNPPTPVTLKRKLKDRPFNELAQPKKLCKDTDVQVQPKQSLEEEIAKLQARLKAAQNKLCKTRKCLEKAEAGNNSNVFNNDKNVINYLTRHLPKVTVDFISTELDMSRINKMVEDGQLKTKH